MSTGFGGLDAGPRTVKVVDMRVGLPWLISSAATVVVSIASMAWSVSAANGKLEALAVVVGKVEHRLDTRDDRLERLAMEVQQNRAQNDVQNQRMQTIEETVRGLHR